MNTPILFLIFNRPDTTKKVWEVIRRNKPLKLFIAADGPRVSKIGEKEVVTEVRQYVMDHIDWDCEVQTLFREENLGCGMAVSKAITWFFEHVDYGIILEDDVMPSDDFFPYCTELLDRYKDEKRIMQVNGVSWVRSKRKESYFFSAYPLIWGWATWKDRWDMYDFKMRELDSFIQDDKIRQITNKSNEMNYHLETLKNKDVDTWDYQWKFTVFNCRGLCITPSKNMISNIGFGEGATHTVNPSSNKADMRTQRLCFPLNHPFKITRNVRADYKYFNFLSPSYLEKAINKVINLVTRKT